MGNFRRSFSKPVAKSPASERTSPDGITHDSKAECKRWCELKMLQTVGSIRKLERQVLFPMLVNGIAVRKQWPADFVYEEWNHKTGEWVRVVEDLKSFDTNVAMITRKLMLALHGVNVRVVKV